MQTQASQHKGKESVMGGWAGAFALRYLPSCVLLQNDECHSLSFFFFGWR